MKNIKITTDLGTFFVKEPLPVKDYTALGITTTRNKWEAAQIEPGEAITLASKIAANNPPEAVSVLVEDIVQPHRIRL